MKARPATIHKKIRKLRTGEKLKLRKGRYDRPVVISGVTATQENPLVIRGSKRVFPDSESCRRSRTVFTSGVDFTTYNSVANRLSRVHEDGGRFPGNYYVADEAVLTLRDCQWVVLEDLTFEDCWPTAIYLENCQNITIRDIHFRGGTFAIGATGSDTRHLLIEGCDWIQDPGCHADREIRYLRSKGRLPEPEDLSKCPLWRTTAWHKIHGSYDAVKKRRVDIDGDARAWDGDFFRAWTIAGYVILRNNCIFDAFNGIHLFNQASKDVQPGLSRHVLIENNWFVRIRDNAVEPEDHALDWTVRHNHFADCYAPFSLSAERSGYFYIYGNVGWNRSVPGPGDDDRSNGRLFKFRKKHKAIGPTYVVHNSWSLRASVFKKHRIACFLHMNNIIAFNDTGSDTSKHPKRVFGKNWQTVLPAGRTADDIIASEAKHFTKEWFRLRIRFDGDMIGNDLLPDIARTAGYPLGPATVCKTPEFVSDDFGVPEGLKLVEPEAAQTFEILLPNGESHAVNDNTDPGLVGAWQRKRRFTLPDPAFVTWWRYPGKCLDHHP